MYAINGHQAPEQPCPTLYARSIGGTTPRLKHLQIPFQKYLGEEENMLSQIYLSNHSVHLVK